MCYESVPSGYRGWRDQGHGVRSLSPGETLFLLDGDTRNICLEHPGILDGTGVNSQLPPTPAPQRGMGSGRSKVSMGAVSHF